MSLTHIGRMAAAVAVAFGVAALAEATGQGQAQSPAAQPSPDAAQKVTVVGCVVRETDYRKAQDAGRGGVAGTGVGAGNEFVLTGHGWTGLVADLLGPWRPEDGGDAGVVPETEPRHLGPFALAYLEALVRVADWRASEKPSASIKPSEVPRGG